VASHAFEVLGDRERAAIEAAREVAIRRRYGSPAQLALALRRRASFLPSREAVLLLEQACEIVDSSPRRALQARVLASYGAALRRAGHAQEARDVLYRAADLAEEMGMQRLRDRAQRELAAAGARPRRTRLHGPDSLTATQSEVAALAAEGLTNREIAERLFVTIKTVETHLMAIYRKLGIHTRDQLATVLDPRADRVGVALGGVGAS
jgi:DNA-binding CsgD family transcriptional regulator